MSVHAAMTPRAHAVVLGGSIAGLLAARVLADHFERVTIAERDKLASENEARKEVRQESPTSPAAGAPEPGLDQIRAAMVASNWSVRDAARALGLKSRYALHGLVKKHGIDGEAPAEPNE